MVLQRNEYEEMENAFLDLHGDEIRKAVYEERKEYIDKEMKYATPIRFIQKYMGSVAFVFIVLYFAWVRDAISLQLLGGLAILVCVISISVYGAWKQDMKSAAIEAYSYMSQRIVSDFVYKKMREDVLSSHGEEDFNKKIQFYSIALHEIPRTFYINVYHDASK